MKICTLCKIEKSLCDFTPRKKGLPALHAWCRLCLNENKRKNQAARRLVNGRPRRLKMGPPKPKAPRKPVSETQKRDQAARAKEYREENREIYAARKSKYRAANRDILNLKQKIYYEANRAKCSAASLEQKKRRYREDPLFAVEGLCRRRLLFAFSRGGYEKSTKTETILGCTFEQLASHLEAQFLPGMSWGNRGMFGWHLDHRVPLSSATTREEIERLSHYTNLQPMWAADNWAKGAKMPHEWEGANHGGSDHVQAERG